VRRSAAALATAVLLAPLGAAAQPAPRDPAAVAAPVPSTIQPAPADLAFGAYQRGLFLTAFREATQRIAADPGDAAAMTLLGELYARGLGVPQDWVKAADWYRLATARGDPQAAYALGMVLLDGRSTTRDPAGARRLLESAAEAVPAAAYSLGGVLLRENTPDSDRRAVALFRRAAAASDVDGQYALAVMLREGRGTAKDPIEAAIWMGRAAAGRNVSAQVEYGIMLFNGDGLRKDEAAAARMFLRAAEQGNPIGQNRVARIYAAGRGFSRDLVEAARWHIVAGRQGMSDPWLDDAVRGLSQADREKAERAAQRWLDLRGAT